MRQTLWPADWFLSMRLALRAMPVQLAPLPPEECRRAIGLAVDHVGDVAQHRGVQQAVHRRVIVEAAIMPALHLIARRHRIGMDGLGFGHGSSCRDCGQSEKLYRRIWSAIVPIQCEKFRPILRSRRARPSFRSTFQGPTSPTAPPPSTGSIRRFATPSSGGIAKPGEPLPPSRTLAKQTGFRRNAVTSAYERLIADGFAVATVGSGTFVAARIPARINIAAAGEDRHRGATARRPGARLHPCR